MFLSLNRNGWRADFHLNRLVTLVVSLANVSCYICPDNRLYFDDTDVSLLFGVTLIVVRLNGDAFVFHSVDAEMSKENKSDFPDRSKLYKPCLGWPCSESLHCVDRVAHKPSAFCSWALSPPFKRRKLVSLWFNRVVLRALWLYSK